MRVSREEIAIPDQRADDVDLVIGGPRTWLAWSTAELGRESVRLAWRDGEGDWTAPLSLAEDSEARARHPALAPLGADGALLVGCVRGTAGYRPAALAVTPAGLARATWPTRGDTFAVAVAGAPGGETGDAIVVWAEGARAGARVGAAWVDARAQVKPIALPEAPAPCWRSSPAVTRANRGAFIAFAEGDAPGIADRLIVVQVSAQGECAPPVVVATGASLSSPALAVLPDGTVAVSWHAPLTADADRVLRWLHVGALASDGACVTQRLPVVVPGSRAAATEDQGWELPALAATPDGILWIGGRSSHGFHLMAGAPAADRWSTRLALSAPGWGGRGRRLAVRAHPDGGVVVARREPEGIALSRLLAPPSPPPAAPPPASPSPEKPRRARPPAPGGAILFGDLHQHTLHSDGSGTVEDLWLHARDRRGLDFAALTDHDRFCRRALGPATWDYQRAQVEVFNDPGRFAAFAAYEYTGPRHPGPGHKCVYFGDSVPDRVPEKELGLIFDALRRHGGVAVPHHVAWTGADFAHHDPELQPVWEICSVHGCYEGESTATPFPPRSDAVLPGQFVRDALNAGLRFGFIASTDSHGLLWHHGVSPRRDPFRTGLAAVFGADLTRASILSALRARRCYATSGARIEVAVDLDGAPMGAELPAGTKGRLGVRARGTAPIARITLVRSGGETPLEPRRRGASPEAEAHATVVADPTRSSEFLYVQILQTDGDMAWSSPIWLG